MRFLSRPSPAILTITTLVTSGAPAVPEAAARELGRRSLKKLLTTVASKVSTVYSGTLGRMLLISEAAGDVLVTSGEIANVYSEMTDPNVRADSDGWRTVSRNMVAVSERSQILHSYVLKPTEMIALLAIWERGDRYVLDSRLRNLIYGHAAKFQTDAKHFGRVTFMIGKMGRAVERSLGTPSLFPAFSLFLRILARLAARKGAPLVGPLASGAMWIFRAKQIGEQSKQ